MGLEGVADDLFYLPRFHSILAANLGDDSQHMSPMEQSLRVD